MRVAALSDVHGNLPALEAVLAEVDRERPDLIVFCGDVASGPMPAETIDRIRELNHARFVRGNADRGLIDAFDGKAPSAMPGPFQDWAAAQIDKSQRDFLASFEASVTLEGIDGVGRVLFCHASPRNDTDVFLISSPEERVRLLMAGVDADLVVCGHTHMQFDRMVDGLRIVNAGSIGMAYGEPGAHWVMLGPGVDLRRTDFDRSSAARRIRELSWPGAGDFAAKNVLSVPTVEEATSFLSRAEAKQVAEAG